MDDLQVYRRRIGLFASSRTIKVKIKVRKDVDAGIRFSLSIVFLAIVSLSSLLNIHDKGIEKNPGPPTVFTNFQYENEMERTLFLELKSQNKLLNKISSHNSFLKNCRDKQLVPNGLTTNLPVSASQPNEELINKINAVTRMNSLEAMDIISKHYDNLIPTINEKITEIENKLKKCCNSEERFQYLLRCLQEFKKKDNKRFGRVKNKKIKTRKSSY